MQDDWNSSVEIDDNDDIDIYSKLINLSKDLEVSTEQEDHAEVVVLNAADNLPMNEPQKNNNKSTPQIHKGNQTQLRHDLEAKAPYK